MHAQLEPVCADGGIGEMLMHIRVAHTDQHSGSCICLDVDMQRQAASTDPLRLLLGATGLLRYSCSVTKPEGQL